VGVEVHIALPSVQHPDQADLTAGEARV
jgi:hypothetical protein